MLRGAWMALDRNYAAISSIWVSRCRRFASIRKLTTFVHLEARRMILAALDCLQFCSYFRLGSNESGRNIVHNRMDAMYIEYS